VKISGVTNFLFLIALKARKKTERYSTLRRKLRRAKCGKSPEIFGKRKITP
jgi:hypothetical protein